MAGGPDALSCDNCGASDDTLVRVRRVYVVPETRDAPGSAAVLPDPELWCVSCCSQYPHELVAEDENVSDSRSPGLRGRPEEPPHV